MLFRVPQGTKTPFETVLPLSAVARYEEEGPSQVGLWLRADACHALRPKVVLTFGSRPSHDKFLKNLGLVLERNPFHAAYRQLDTQIGEGGFGKVFLAHRRGDPGKTVAVKVSKAHHGDAPSFAAEVEGLKACEGCEFIVQLLDTFDLTEEGVPRRYIVMEHAVRGICFLFDSPPLFFFLFFEMRKMAHALTPAPPLAGGRLRDGGAGGAAVAVQRGALPAPARVRRRGEGGHLAPPARPLLPPFQAAAAPGREARQCVATGEG